MLPASTDDRVLKDQQFSGKKAVNFFKRLFKETLMEASS